jgi:hypothetical protein
MDEHVRRPTSAIAVEKNMMADVLGGDTGPSRDDDARYLYIQCYDTAWLLVAHVISGEPCLS